MTRKWIVRLVIATLFGTGFFVTLAFLLMHSVPSDNREMLFAMIGYLVGVVSAMVSFYFGDSEGSDTDSQTKSHGR